MAKNHDRQIGYSPILVLGESTSMSVMVQRLQRGKWIISLSAIFFLMLAGIYLAITPTIYESRAVVQIGRVGRVFGKPLHAVLKNNQPRPDYQPLSSGVRLASRLMHTYAPPLYAIIPDKNDPSILTFIARAHSPAKAQSLLQGVLRKVITSQRMEYDKIIQPRQLQLAQWQHQYQELEKIRKHQKESATDNTESRAVLNLEKVNILTEMSAFSRQIFMAEDNLSPINNAPTRITLDATYDQSPIQPRTSFVLIIALLFGLIIGVFAVLLESPHN